MKKIWLAVFACILMGTIPVHAEPISTFSYCITITAGCDGGYGLLDTTIIGDGPNFLVTEYAFFPTIPYGDNIIYPDVATPLQVDGSGLSILSGHLADGSPVYTRVFFNGVNDTYGQFLDGTIELADEIGTFSVELAPAPLPPALPLFAASLCALGLFIWRRKQITLQV